MAEKIRVAVCVPSSGECEIFFAQSLAGLMQCAQVLRSRAEAEGFSITVLAQESSVIHGNREQLVDRALKWGCTHVLFLDDDMVFNPIVLEMLLGRRQPYVACNYPKRQFPIVFTATRADKTRDMVTDKTTTALEEAWYTGFGVCLIERQVFEKTPKPWFLPKYVPDLNEYTTEDNPFCERIREQGFKILVDHTASKMVGHIGRHVYTWKDIVVEEEQEAPATPQFSVVANVA